MNAKTIQKYKTKSVPKLIEIAQVHFNKYIRERDMDQPCIDCNNYRTLQAGHFYPTSTYSSMRFIENNCNGECLPCNYYDSQSHAYGYQPNLIKKIGQLEFDKLEIMAGISKRTTAKWDRFSLIDIIEKYKELNKQNR